MAILVSAQGLQKSFGARALFNNLSLVIESGDRIGLIGTNGSGKSTLLKILSQKIEPDEGKLALQKGLRVGYLSQTPELEMEHTIEEEIISRAQDPASEEAHSLTREWIAKLNLDTQNISSTTKIKQLSGGWQKKIALARELVREPELLLLDEPTNHLDVESIIWLEDLLTRSAFATVVVTHDRLFLQKITTRIFELGIQFPQGVLDVRGNYSNYLELREARLSQQRTEELILKNKLRTETEWLRRGPKARTTKQKARIDRAEELGSEVKELEFRNRQREINFEFQAREKQPKRLIEARGVSKNYGDKTLFKNLDLFIGPGTRVGLLGGNGCGKSTLIRCLLGEENVSSGTIIRAEDLKVAYFEQKRESLDPRLTLKQTLCPGGDMVNYRGQMVHIRGFLDRFLFSKDQVEMTVSKLSGGEQARLLLARLMLKEAQVLVLDEPTNDLDIEALDVLQNCLTDFQGAVILVTHDRYFLDQVATEIIAFPFVAQASTELIKFADLWQWENWRQTQMPAKTAKEINLSDSTSRKKKKISYHEVRELSTMEERIRSAEEKLSQCEIEANLPENLSNAKKLSELYQQIASTQQEIERLYARWAELEAKSDGV